MTGAGQSLPFLTLLIQLPALGITDQWITGLPGL